MTERASAHGAIEVPVTQGAGRVTAVVERPDGISYTVTATFERGATLTYVCEPDGPGRTPPMVGAPVSYEMRWMR